VAVSLSVAGYSEADCDTARLPIKDFFTWPRVCRRATEA